MPDDNTSQDDSKGSTLDSDVNGINNSQDDDSLFNDDSILDLLDDDDADKSDDSKTKKTDETFSKKIGTHTFTSQADYDKFVDKLYGDVTRLTGEVNKQKSGDNKVEVKPTETKTVEEKPKDDINALRWKFKVQDHFEAHPEDLPLKEDMAYALRTGKAKDENGRPSLTKAAEIARRMNGVEPEDKNKNEDNNKVIKKLSGAGGGNSNGYSGASTYNSQDDVKGASDFADAAIFKIR